MHVRNIFAEIRQVLVWCSCASISDLPEDIQMAILHPDSDPYKLLKALSFLLYYAVLSFFLPFVTDIDVDLCWERTACFFCKTWRTSRP